ncbi:MAG TPA: hypothetical protein VLV54_16860 [Thermoanaerobaculia bacterium]|nr:hypothetical protein [Thermoanaerobaculia bacterium]
MRTHFTFTFATLLLITAMVWCASPASAQVDALCAASITLNFDPPARLVLPPAPAPHTTATGGGTITACVVLDGGPTAGTFTFSLEGDMTCTSTENIVGTLDVVWADNTESHTEVSNLLPVLGSAGGAAGLTATVTSGRFAGDQLLINNVRDPLALIRCVSTGLSQAKGTTVLTFTQPL